MQRLFKSALKCKFVLPKLQNSVISRDFKITSMVKKNKYTRKFKKRVVQIKISSKKVHFFLILIDFNLLLIMSHAKFVGPKHETIAQNMS